MNQEDKWYIEGKKYLLIQKLGIDFLKNNLVNYEKLFQSELFHHELPYVVIKELGNKINKVSLIAFDEEHEELYILVGNYQYKFSLHNNILHLNDSIVNIKTIHIPEFEDNDDVVINEKVFIKK